jgi:hypothetical protein
MKWQPDGLSHLGSARWEIYQYNAQEVRAERCTRAVFADVQGRSSAALPVLGVGLGVASWQKIQKSTISLS